MFQKFIGAGLALVGLGAICVGLYIFATQPTPQGDPSGTMLKAILCGIGGFVSVACGYSMADGTFFNESISNDEEEDEEEVAAEDGKKTVEQK